MFERNFAIVTVEHYLLTSLPSSLQEWVFTRMPRGCTVLLLDLSLFPISLPYLITHVISSFYRPDMETKKRRGGRRMRQLKEQFAETEMMKQANRRGFSVETGEYGDDAMGLTLGMLEKTKDGSGNIRHMAGSAANKRKMKQSNTKAARKRAAQMNAGGQANGLATSMVFTPVQGMELVNPAAARERVKAANNNWFSENSGFQSALPKKK